MRSVYEIGLLQDRLLIQGSRIEHIWQLVSSCYQHREATISDNLGFEHRSGDSVWIRTYDRDQIPILTMFRDVGFYRGGPVFMSALSGIDIALWDLKGE
jgi:hypothetical protein